MHTIVKKNNKFKQLKKNKSEIDKINRNRLGSLIKQSFSDLIFSQILIYLGFFGTIIHQIPINHRIYF